MPKNELVFRDDTRLGRLPYLTGRADRILRHTELEVFKHGLAVAAEAECEIQKAEALGDVIRNSLDEELDLLKWGLHRANGSLAATELVARKVNLFSTINDRHINQTYGR